MATTDVKLTVPEAARRLGMDGGDVYRLVFRAVLPAHRGSDGAIYIDQAAVDGYRAHHFQGSQPRP